MFSCQGLCPNQRFLSKYTMYANYLKYFKIMKMIMKILSCQGLCPNQRFLSMKIDYICDQYDHFINSGYVWTNFPYFSQAWVTKTYCLVKESTHRVIERLSVSASYISLHNKYTNIQEFLTSDKLMLFLFQGFSLE